MTNNTLKKKTKRSSDFTLLRGIDKKTKVQSRHMTSLNLTVWVGRNWSIILSIIEFANLADMRKFVFRVLGLTLINQLILETASSLAQADLELTMWWSMTWNFTFTLNLWSSCLHLPSRVMGMHPHIQPDSMLGNYSTLDSVPQPLLLI